MTIPDRARELDAIADFIDWLCDKGYVVAKRDDVHLWTPISEGDGAFLAAEFLTFRTPPLATPDATVALARLFKNLIHNWSDTTEIAMLEVGLLDKDTGELTPLGRAAIALAHTGGKMVTDEMFEAMLEALEKRGWTACRNPTIETELRAALEAAQALDPRLRPVAGDAVEAALATWFGMDGWRTTFGNEAIHLQRMSDTIAAADRARNWTFVEWRKPEEFQSVAITKSKRNIIWSFKDGEFIRLWGHEDGPPSATAWTEIPAPPPWTTQSPERRSDEAAPRDAPSDTTTPESPRVAALAGDVVPFTRELLTLLRETAAWVDEYVPGMIVKHPLQEYLEAAFPEDAK